MIYHIVSESEWESAQANHKYEADSLKSEGFIHCSKKDQVAVVAKDLFDGRDDLLLLAIDEAKLNSPVKYEPNSQGEKFPHIYGPINLEAVVGVQPLWQNKKGDFVLDD